ncbi:MAG: hypothetical protein KGJ58_00980 [Patescibacteria group bacterium]|nr:hypothetical protein [Patescibacteria group bacterium]MDE2218015.1 hypothetical protein [Patescibacteria group bacterium]
MNYSEQILKARFEQLPEGVKEAIIATPWKDKLAQIASMHRLHIDQADRLSKETIIVMFGLDHPDNLVYNIAKNVDVSEEKAEAIAEDLNREIFLKVRESLKKIFEEREGAESGSLGKTGEKTAETETEEIPSKEDILREIEDKEHRNLPTVDKSELHLEIKPASEIVEKTASWTNHPQIERISFKKGESDVKVKMEKATETNPFRNSDALEREKKIFERVNRIPTQEQPDIISESKRSMETKRASEEGAPQAETIKTMRSDIFKSKMSGTVNAPRETIETNDSKSSPKMKPSDTGKKIDPYREEVR